MCAWQFVGVVQCCSVSCHRSADAGSGPSCASAARPANGMVWPTLHCVDAVGLSMVTTGALLGGLPTVTVTVVVPDSPPGSVTRSPTCTTACVTYVYVGFTTVESSYAPSASRSHA